MTLSLTCACGARLEIDPKFAGKVVNCPDCNRPLSTTPSVPLPARTSLLALASFVLALVGAFTLAGTIVAVVLGALALGQIARAPEPLGGRRFALAGIAVGVVFTLLTFTALTATELLGLDGLLRTFEWAGKIDYQGELTVSIDERAGIDKIKVASIQRPSLSWGKAQYTREEHELLALVNVWDDAHILVLTKDLTRPESLEVCREEGQQRFLDSELVKTILGRSRGKSPGPTGTDRDRKQLPGTEIQEFYFDTRLAGIDRTFLIHVHREGSKIMVVAGGTRKNRFQRLQGQLRTALESFKTEK